MVGEEGHDLHDVRIGHLVRGEGHEDHQSRKGEGGRGGKGEVGEAGGEEHQPEAAEEDEGKLPEEVEVGPRC